jgi:hypothetical protein
MKIGLSLKCILYLGPWEEVDGGRKRLNQQAYLVFDRADFVGDVPGPLTLPIELVEDLDARYDEFPLSRRATIRFTNDFLSQHVGLTALTYCWLEGFTPETIELFEKGSSEFAITFNTDATSEGFITFLQIMILLKDHLLRENAFDSNQIFLSQDLRRRDDRH